MSKRTLSRAAAALMLLPLLGGCVAAIAVPLMTLTGVLTEKKRTRAQIVADLPAANAAALAAMPEPVVAVPDQPAQFALPRAPLNDLVLADGPWRDFATYSVMRAARLANSDQAASALLTPESVLTFDNRMRACKAREAAVVVDLDPGGAVFDPASAGMASPGIAATLEELRAAGVIVLWVSQASANNVADVAAALKNSGLDPTGRDPILLVRNADERKQVLREEANETVCVVAMAGDRRSDFDELFDYLRDPRLATAYDKQIGAGWFIVPSLFDTAVPESASVVTPTGEYSGR